MLHELMSSMICYVLDGPVAERHLLTDAAIDSWVGLHHMLRQEKQRLGAAGLRVAKFIDENRQIVLASSAAALGARIGTSDATVLRTIQALGFASLADLKSAILNSGTVSTPADDMRRSEEHTSV